MKTNRTLNLCGAGLVALNLAVLPTFADTSLDSRAIHTALSKATAPEMGSIAASLVKQAPAKQAETAAKDVVQAAIKISPATTVAVVGAVSKENFQLAPVVAGAAAAKMPKLAVAIAKAAVTAAPSQAGKIVQAVCKEVPRDYSAVAVAVAQLVPSAGKEILQGVAAAIPSVRAYLAGVESSYAQPGTVVPVAAILSQAGTVTQTASASGNGFEPLVSPPTQEGPFRPLGGTATETTTGNNSVVPFGGRDYSGP